MRIGIDAMGGDKAPGPEIQGALEARELLQEGDRIVLVGREPILREHLSVSPDWEKWIEIRHAEQVIGMNESPIEALRTKPNSSAAVLFEMQKNGELDAGISAGNTGAVVAAAQMSLRRLSGVHRPGISILSPNFKGVVAICDVGANVNCRPQHLHQYGVMSSIYLNALYGVENPRVGLLSIGEEDAKGNSLTKKTRELMREDPKLNFIGNVEGRDLFTGTCDVVICDGFVGNVVIKLMEGMAGGVLKAIFSEVSKAFPGKEGLIQLAGGAIMSKFDYNEYGGAPLLGVGGICIICHGASSHRAFYNAVRVTKDFAGHHVNERITEWLAQN